MLLLRQGDTATSMAAVAASAGVSAQTVYNAFGSKPGLVKRVYDVTLVGDDEAVPFAERPRRWRCGPSPTLTGSSSAMPSSGAR